MLASIQCSMSLYICRFTIGIFLDDILTCRSRKSVGDNIKDGSVFSSSLILCIILIPTLSFHIVPHSFLSPTFCLSCPHPLSTCSICG